MFRFRFKPFVRRPHNLQDSGADDTGLRINLDQLSEDDRSENAEDEEEEEEGDFDYEPLGYDDNDDDDNSGFWV